MSECYFMNYFIFCMWMCIVDSCHVYSKLKNKSKMHKLFWSCGYVLINVIVNRFECE